MTGVQAGFALRRRNPDVLTCIANLSNDEVFTPPEFANTMLDTLAGAWAIDNNGASLWENATVRFLDPVTKSGVFLREITSRLTNGLKHEIPDLHERVDHILTEQVFGIGVTYLTSLLARRSLYCSKIADGPHSIAKSFTNGAGNVWFERLEHTWVGGTERVYTADSEGKSIERVTNGKCKHCGANQKTFDRGDELESHAYAFIHTDDTSPRLAEMFGADMQFDVIIGNPPYQLSDGGHGASAVPIYQKFVEQAMAMEPRLLSMVIPSRWFFGGRGLQSFRDSMLGDKRIRYLADFPDSRDAFSGVDVAGGVCYFLWDRDNLGDCEVATFASDGLESTSVRPLREPGSDVFIRNNASIAVLNKIVRSETGEVGVILPPEMRFDAQVTGQKPFGLRTYFRGTDEKKGANDLLVLQSGGRGWVSRANVTEGVELIDKWKVFTSKSSSEHAGQVDKSGMRRVLSKSGVLPPGSVVTETYVIVGGFDSEEEARNCFSYLCTRFFRFLVATRSSAQDLPRSAYTFVPLQDFSRPWTDEELYAKYGLSADEVSVIESAIRPMDVGTDPDD